MNEPTHVVWHGNTVSRAQREAQNGHRGCVIWFTGLSGCGKSTIANAVDAKLHQMGVRSYVLDGDNVRHGLNAGPQMLAERHGEAFAQRFGLTFEAMDREENIRRIGAVAGLFCDAGIVTLAAFVSPYRKDRDAVRDALPTGDFIEIFVNTPLELCEQRDPKGLYKLARAGKLRNFTGIDDPYEPPEQAEITLETASREVGQLADDVLSALQARGIIGPRKPS
jgi:adenylylsulfate kinase